jgi:hypothetical protein
LAPATIHWINPASGDWGVAGNWDLSRVPNSSDDVIINTPNITVHHSSGTDGANSLTSTANIDISGGSLGCGQASSISGNLSISGGFLTFSRASSVSGNLTVSSGTLYAGGITGADLTVTAPMTWTGGVIAGVSRVLANGGLTINGAGEKDLGGSYGGTLVNGGAATWTGTGSIVGGAYSAFINQAGATFDAQNDGQFRGGSLAPFHNAGTFRKSGGGATIITAEFDTTGTVNVQTGTLSLEDGYSFDGTFTIAAGATLDVHLGGRFPATSSVSGAGTVSFSGGSTNVLGSYNVTGTTSVSAGTVEFDSGASSANTNLSGGSLNVSGTGSFTTTGTFNWTGGAVGGGSHADIAPLGLLNISGPTEKDLTGVTVNNFGTATWTGTGNIVVSGRSVFNNKANATFDVQNDVRLVYASLGGTFNNDGTLRKSRGGGTTAIEVDLNNNGVVDVASGVTGVLSFAGGGTSGGSFTVAAQATLDFAVGGGRTLTAASSLSSAGTVSFSGSTTAIYGSYNVSGSTIITGGEVDFNSVATTVTAALSGGLLAGGLGNLTTTRSFTWTGGGMGGPGTTTIASGATLLIMGAGEKDLSSRTLNNFGTTTWTDAGNIVGAGRCIFNNKPGAVFDAQNDARFIYGLQGGTFNNDGTLRKSAGNGTTSIEVDLFNNGLVDVPVPVTGTLSLADSGTSTGSFTVSALATLAFASGGSRTLTAASSVSGPGTVSFSGNNTYLNGSYNVTHSVVTGGEVDFNGPATVGTATLSGGTLAGSGNLTVTNNITWSSGVLGGTGATTVNVGATLTIMGAGTKDFGRTINNFGTTTWTDAGNITGERYSLFHNEAGATFNAQNAARYTSLGGTFTNEGTFLKSAGAGTTSIEVGFNNTGGTINVRTATVSLSGGLTNFSGTTLTGGSYLVAGTLQFNGADIRTNAATIVLDGAASRIVDASNADALANFASNAAAGSFTIQNGRSFTTAGDFANNGTLTLGPGLFTVHGNYSQGAAGILNVALNGTAPGSGYGQLQVSGTATLTAGASLNPTLGFVSANGDTFSILPATGGMSGTFNGLSDGATFALNGERFRINYPAGGVVLTHFANVATHLNFVESATVTAGTPFGITVQALDGNNNVDTGYTGTVHFTASNGAQANYTFQPADQGQRTFTLTLYRAGALTVTGTDTVTGITGTTSFAVTPAAADHLSFSEPATVTAGVPFQITATVQDACNNTVTGYTGTVHFTASNGVMANYTFQPSDMGQRTFTITLYRAGTLSVTGTDTVTGITGTTSFTVISAAADHLVFLQQPTDTAAGQTMGPVAVAVVDQYGNVVSGDNSDMVSLSLNPGGAGGTLHGTLTLAAVNGVATFSDLSIDVAGLGYTLHATLGGSLPDIDSNPFNITP